MACSGSLGGSFLDFSCSLRFLFPGSLLLLFLFRVVLAYAGPVHAPLDELVEAIALVFEKVERVILHVRVNVALLDVLLVKEARYLARARILRRFLEVFRKVSFPVGVDEVVVHGLEGLDFAVGPLVQVHRLYLRDMHAQGTMLT